GPGVIEHELAVRVVLQVTGNRADEFVAVVPQREVPGRPAPVLAQAAMRFQPGQEGVADEGVAAVMQAIPLRGGDGFQAVEESDVGHPPRIRQSAADVAAFRTRMPYGKT